MFVLTLLRHTLYFAQVISKWFWQFIIVRRIVGFLDFVHRLKLKKRTQPLYLSDSTPPPSHPFPSGRKHMQFLFSLIYDDRYLNKDRPTWCHLFHYFTIYCSACLECWYIHLQELATYCGFISCVVLLWFDVCWCYGVVRLGWSGILMK